MEQRTCPTCGSSFIPGTANQRYCPPTDADRERRADASQARSRCAKRGANHAQRTREGRDTLARDAPMVTAFDCAQCRTRCVPGENVAPHASKFCGAECKIAWHRGLSRDRRALVYVGRDTAAIARWREHCAHLTLANYFGRLRKSDTVAYRRALRADPCAYCGQASEALDHIDPCLRGGSDGWTNRTATCHTCNSLKGSLTLLQALPWIPVAIEYHTMRRALFAA